MTKEQFERLTKALEEIRSVTPIRAGVFGEHTQPMTMVDLDAMKVYEFGDYLPKEKPREGFWIQWPRHSDDVMWVHMLHPTIDRGEYIELQREARCEGVGWRQYWVNAAYSQGGLEYTLSLIKFLLDHVKVEGVANG